MEQEQRAEQLEQEQIAEQLEQELIAEQLEPEHIAEQLKQEQQSNWNRNILQCSKIRNMGTGDVVAHWQRTAPVF